MSFVYQFIGVMLILIGIPLTPTPIPIGLVLIGLGMALLISNSSLMRELVRSLRRRNQRFDRFLHNAKRYVPHPFSRVLERTEAEEEAAATSAKEENKDQGEDVDEAENGKPNPG